MTTNFPTSVDAFTNPTSADTLDNPPHDQQHADINDAMEAVQTALLDGAPLHIDDVNERVGIGTTSPARPLEVDGGSLGVAATFKSNNATGGISLMGSSTTDDTRVRIGAEGNDLRLFSNNLERVRIASSGNVGINDTTPSYKLDVNGDINSQTDVLVSGTSLPRGIIVNQQDTTSNLTISTGNQNILVNSTTLVAGRKYLCQYSIQDFYSPSTTLNVRCRLFIEGVRVSATSLSLSSTNPVGFASGSYVFTAAGGGGNHYFDVDTNTGTCQYLSSTVQRSSLIIIDLGD